MSYRAYNICCNRYSFTKETEFLRDLFRQNGYPGVTFENCVKRFVDSKFIQPNLIQVEAEVHIDASDEEGDQITVLQIGFIVRHFNTLI